MGLQLQHSAFALMLVLDDTGSKTKRRHAAQFIEIDGDRPTRRLAHQVRRRGSQTPVVRPARIGSAAACVRAAELRFDVDLFARRR